MARVNLQLIAPQQLSASAANLYTVPTNRTTVITRITFTNTTTTDRWVSLWLVASGDTPVDSNQIIDQFVVAAMETFSSPDVEGHAIPTNSSIQVQGEVASAITIVASGTEITV